MARFYCAILFESQAFSALHATHIAVNRRQIARRNYWTPSFIRFVPRSVACWPTNARAFLLCWGNKGSPTSLCACRTRARRTRKFARISSFVTVVEFHLRNNIPRIPFVEIHSPLSELVHYVKVSQQRIVSRLGNEWRNARYP